MKAKLDPELKAIVRRLLPCERVWVVKKFRWWADQLIANARGMAGPPDTQPKVTYASLETLARN